MIKSLLFSVLIITLITACGFSPVYGQNSGKIPPVSLGKQDGRYANLMNDAIKTRLQARDSLSTNGDWILSYDLSESTQALGITQQAASTYSMLTVTVEYTVTSDKKIIATRKRTQRQGYDIVPSTFGSDQTLNDARAKAINTLSDAIIQDLVVLKKKQNNIN